MPFGDTIAALSTPPGEAALGVLRLSGPLCPTLARDCFGRRKAPPPRRATLGAYRPLGGDIIEECVFVLFEEGASYTGESVLELSCHGNPLLLQRILEDLLARGCRLAQPGEFTRTAFLNGRLDLTQAEAVADLITARGDHAIESARRQLDGRLGERVGALADRLVAIMAIIEAYIDFPEEDLPTEDPAGPIARLEALDHDLSELAGTSRYREALRQGLRVAIVGAPNAGKSSLLNALVGEDRALVAAEPGTTRDYLSETATLGPWCIRFTDTAGLREGEAGEIERMGMERSRQQAAAADLILCVLDATLQSPPLPALIAVLGDPGHVIVVENKVDLPGADGAGGVLPGAPHVRLSALTGEGLDVLRGTILRVLEERAIVPGHDDLVVSTRHAACLRAAAEAVRESRRKLLGGEPSELAASDLRGALDELGAIVGKIDNEALLDQLFARFCIGK